MTDRQRLNLYKKEYLDRFYRGGTQHRPKFHLGDEVRVREDADTIYGSWFDDHLNKSETGWIAGFDQCRQEAKKRKRAGVVVKITYVPMQLISAGMGKYFGEEKTLKDFEDICFDYSVKFPGGRCISFCGVWLRKAK